jgi:hypothetical protein
MILVAEGRDHVFGGPNFGKRRKDRFSPVENRTISKWSGKRDRLVAAEHDAVQILTSWD